MPENNDTATRTSECPFLSLSGHPSRNPRTKAEVLRHYFAHEEPTHFIQFDGFNPPSYGRGDEDADEFWRNHTYELMHGTNVVRVLAAPGVDAVVAVRVLRKIADWIENCPETLSEKADSGDLPH